MAQEIARAQAVPAYQLVPDAELRDHAKVLAIMTEGGFDGAVTMQLLKVKKEATHIAEIRSPSPGSSGYRSRYGSGSFSDSYGRSWGGAYVYQGYTQVDEVVEIETRVYSLKDDKLIWMGVSETFNPTSVKTAVKEIAAAVAADMRKKGLLPPKEKAAKPNPSKTPAEEKK